NKAFFADLPEEIEVIRYHSLVIDKATCPESLEVISTDAYGEIMAVKHKDYPLYGVHLGYEEAKILFNAVLDGQVNEAGIASILTALKMKGESAQEIAGAAQALRSRTKKFKLDRPVVDTCGTGGDGSGSFNISTAAAIVAAGSGCYVA
ncbi:Anthranilate phosphoribosyl transferase like protein, partial [Aduncisulcus paluster]